MGLESVNYYFKFKELAVETDMENIFKFERGFVKKKEGLIIYYDFNFWIDVQLVGNNSKTSALSIRIALCNPINGIKVAFQMLLEKLFGSLSNCELIDLNTKKHFTSLNKEIWNQVWIDYELKQKEFEILYGYVELPVSSTLFFKYLNEKNDTALL
jgi:hypothetical protein